MSNFFLADRVKETSRIVGTVDIQLDGAVNGFSSFGDFYASGDVVFYAITDNIKYEIGSGIFQPDGVNDSISRNPIRSSDINIGPWYVDGTSNSGPTDGQAGKFYPLWLSRSAALSGVGFNDGPYTAVSGISFDEHPGQTFYHITEYAALGVVDPTPPSGADFGAASAPVTFTAGLKEVFVTYPGKTSVFNGYGLEAGIKEPKQSGVAFWQNENMLNYSSELVWDDTNGFLGVGKTPEYPIDVGGLVADALIRASGFIDGGSGIAFSGGQLTDTLLTASGGQQLEPFLRNRKGTAAEGVIVLSGVVDQIIDFADQPPGTVFAGPASGWCGTPPCASQVPTFRQINVDDLPPTDDFLNKYAFVIQDNTGLDGQSANVEGQGLFTAGMVPLYATSGEITYDSGIFFDAALNRLMLNGDPNIQSPSYNLDIKEGDLRAASGTLNQLLFNNNLIQVGERTGRFEGNDAENYYSVSIGYHASTQASGEFSCISIGNQAGSYSVDNSGVVIIGKEAVTSGTLNINDIFAGSFAGRNASGIEYSTAIGFEAALNASGVDFCVLEGVRAGSGLTNSSFLTAIGSGAAANSDLVLLSAAIGQQAMFGAEDMETCYMLGTAAGSGSAGFVQSVGVGSSSFKEAFAVSQSVAIGQDAGLYVSGVSNSYYMGTGAGKSGILSDKIFAFGHGAAVETSGSFNVYLGNNAGIAVSGHENIEIIASGGLDSLIGHEASGKLNIGNIVVGDVYSNRVGLGSPESVSPSATLYVETLNADEPAMIIKHQGSGSASPYFALQSGDYTTFMWINNSGDINTSGCVKPSGGVNLPNNVPSSTTNKLYNDGGSLYWNGSLVDTAGSTTLKVANDTEVYADAATTWTDGQLATFSGVDGCEVTQVGRFFKFGALELSGVLQPQISANQFAFRVSSSGEEGSNNNSPFLMDQTDVAVPPLVVMSGISGVNIDSFQLDDGTNNSGIFVIGYDANASYSFNFTNGDFADDPIANAETVTISGVSGVRAEYDAANNFFRLGANELSGVLYSTTIDSGNYLNGQILENTTSGVSISGIAEWASGEFARAGLSETNGTSGIIKQDSHFILDEAGSGALSTLYFTKGVGGNIDIRGGNVGDTNDNPVGTFEESILIGSGNAASTALTATSKAIVIGHNAAAIGSTTDSLDRSVIVGANAAYVNGGTTGGFENAVILGAGAGGNQVGGTGQVLVGKEAGYGSVFNPDVGFNHNLIAVGQKAAFLMGSGQADAKNVAVGYQAMASSHSMQNALAFGELAASSSADIKESTAIGTNAFLGSENLENSIGIGQNALRNASGVTNVVAIGQDTAQDASGVFDGDDVGSLIAIGNNAAYQAKSSSQMTAIGSDSAYQVSGCKHSVFIGRGAGYKRGGSHTNVGPTPFSDDLSRNCLIISNRSTLPATYDADWSKRHTNAVVDLASVVQGLSEPYVYMHIGEPLPSDTANDGSIEARITGAALNITKSRDSDNTLRLKLYTDSSDDFDITAGLMAPAMVSETWADVSNVNGIVLAEPVKHTDNTPIVNKFGFLRLPFATDTVGSSSNYQLLDGRGEVIGKTAGAVAIIEGGLLIGQPNPVQAYSDGTNWYVGTVGTQLS